MQQIGRRHALRWIGTAAAAGALGPSLLERILFAQAPIDWAARVAALPQPAADEVVIAAVGDLMISDPVSNRALPEAQAMYRVLQDADVAFANCEQSVSNQGTLKGGFPQTAPPEILDEFRASGLNMLSFANNHSFDMGEAGLFGSLDEARKREFTVAGAGRNLTEVTAAGVRTVKGQRVALLAFMCCPADYQSPDDMAQYRANASKSGIGLITGERVVVPGWEIPLMLPNAADMRTMTEAVQRAKAEADIVLVSLHQHWNLDLPPGQGGRGRGGAPPRTLVPAQLDRPGNLVAEGRKVINRAAVDAGADIVIGHGPHVLNGVEVYRGKPIFYSLSHFYMALLRDGRALPRLQISPSLARLAETNYYLEEHRWAAIARVFVRRGGAVTRAQILPVWMDVQKDGLPIFPPDAEAQTINSALGELSRPFGTGLRSAGWYLELSL